MGYHEGNEDESITEDDVKISVLEFAKFLSESGRSPECPLCPHTGDWGFHTDVSDRTMMRVHAVGRPGTFNEYIPVALMDCPNCGFLVQTNLMTVVRHFRGTKKP